MRNEDWAKLTKIHGGGNFERTRPTKPRISRWPSYPWTNLRIGYRITNIGLYMLAVIREVCREINTSIKRG
jgi:hypothetical protein